MTHQDAETQRKCSICASSKNLFQASFPYIFPDLDPFYVCQTCRGDGSFQKWLMALIIHDNPELKTEPRSSLNMTAVAEGAEARINDDENGGITDNPYRTTTDAFHDWYRGYNQ